MTDYRERNNEEGVAVDKLTFRMSTIVALAVSCLLGAYASAQPYVVRDGRATSVIVLSTTAQGLNRYAAEELQKYIGQVTGVQPEIVDSTAVAEQPKDVALI